VANLAIVFESLFKNETLQGQNIRQKIHYITKHIEQYMHSYVSGFEKHKLILIWLRELCWVK